MKINDSKEEVVKSFNLYTGLCDMEIVAVNPTKDELLEKFKIDVDKEPQYKDLDLQNDGKLQNKLVFYLNRKEALVKQLDNTVKIENVSSRLEFFVAPKENIASTGNKQVVNRLGQCSWGTIEGVEANPKMSWFHNDPYHYALVGEEKVSLFLRHYFNLVAEDNFDLDMTKLFSLDFSEFNKVLSQAQKFKNAVTVLLGVTTSKDGTKHYQTTYNKQFSRPTIKIGTTKTMFTNALNENYGQFGSNSNPTDWNNSFDLQVYDPSGLDVPDSKTNEEATPFI